MATLARTLGLPVASRGQNLRHWPVVLYALTGFSGVLAEQGFEKYLSLLVGATVYSSAIVIFAYFLGFGLGGWAAAALIKRSHIRHPLRLYGLAELAVGISCIAFSYAFHPLADRLSPWQAVAATGFARVLVRFVFGAALILPTAALMGASFPLIAEALDRSNTWSGRRWIEAYAANLAGAVAAALGGAFVLLPALGVRGSLWVCFGIGVAAFAGTFWLPAPDQERRTADVRTAALERVDGAWLLIGAAFASGLVFFALEVIWTHLLATTLGNSVYAFSSMLGAVLLGLLIGSLHANRREVGRPVQYSRLFQFAGLLLVVQFRLWDYSQIAFMIPIPGALKNFYTVEAFKFLVAALLIIPPAVLLGTIYPSLLRSRRLARTNTSYLVGYLNTANSIGCLAGALLGIFFLIPVVGSEWSLKAMAILLVLAGVPFLRYEGGGRKALASSLIGGGIVIAYACAWNWNRLLLTSGINVYFGSSNFAVAKQEPTKEKGNQNQEPRLLFFEEHPQGGLTTVIEARKPPYKRMLLSNGKYEGTDDLRDQGYAQIGFSAIPSQFVGAFDRSALIGLGTGHSGHALAKLGYKRVDIAEYAPGIVRAAAGYFGRINGNVLAEPNVRLAVEDGRNLLLTTPPASYDLITIEITSVWFAGATNLYSQEFYQLAKSRLNNGGVLQQWIQLHHISPAEIGSALATVRSVFKFASFWWAGGQGMIVATDHEQLVTPERRAYMEQQLKSLAAIPDSALADLYAQMFDSRVLAPEAVDYLIQQSQPVINTDHNRWIEYATPRYNWTDNNWARQNLAWLRNMQRTAGARNSMVSMAEYR